MYYCDGTRLFGGKNKWKRLINMGNRHKDVEIRKLIKQKKQSKVVARQGFMDGIS